MGTITTGLCNSFKLECFGGIHIFGTDIFKAALIKATPTNSYGAANTNYSDLGTDEVSGTGYTAGGVALTGVVASLSSGVAIVTCDMPSWPAAVITARGVMIYNSSKSGKAVALYDFGADIVDSNGTFLLQIPAADSTHALIRFGG